MMAGSMHPWIVGARRRRRGLVVVAVSAALVASVGSAPAVPAGADPVGVAGPAPASASEPSAPAASPAPDPTPEPGSGQAVIEDEPERIDDIAQANGVTVEQATRILADPTAFVSEADRIFYVEPEPPKSASAEEPATPNAAPYADTFKLNSKPGSSRTIYLDFDGHTISGTSWTVDDGGPFTAKAYNPDGVPGFSLSDLADIQTVWQVVAEDYAPFDVNVTTQDPGIDKIRRSTSSDTEYGTRAVITDSTDIEVVGYPAGGVAYLGVFDAIGAQHDQGQPAWAFGSGFWSKKMLGDAISHEVGHNLGLQHDGSADDGEYYKGHGVWGPIMGNSYERPVAQWSKGEYATATNTENDYVVMASHGLATRADDHTNVLATATPLTGTATGTITAASDLDLFKYAATSTGTWNFRATPDPTAPNLDIKLTLLSAAGSQLAQDNPDVVGVDEATATGLDASISYSVTSGATYYVRVESSPYLTASTGYTTYGSIGAYSVSASSGPTCASQDTQEPNDTASTAAVAASGQAIASRVCSGNVDYYGVQVLQGQTVSASLLFTHAQGDLNLSLFDPTGAQVASATSTTDDEALNHVAATSGVYIVEVFGKAGAANTYSLTVTSPLCPPDDASENNDTSATAKALQAGVQVSGISCVGDQDFYSFPVPQDGSINVELAHNGRYAPLSIQLLSSTGTVLAEDQSEFGRDDLFLQHTNWDAADVRRIRVVPGAVNSLYSLVLRSGPAAPTGVTAVPGPGSATVNWTDPVDTGGRPILSYEVTAYVGGVEVGSAYPTTKPAVISHLAPGVSHTFKVRATNAIGSGPRSAASGAIVPVAPLVPGAPGEPYAAVGDGRATVGWGPPADDGGSVVTGYVVTPYIGAVAQTPRVFDANLTQQEITGLTNGTSYTFKVAATNVTGTGPQSVSSNAVTPISVPAAPTGVVAVAGYQSVTVSWTPPAGGVAPITGFVITSYVDGLEWDRVTVDDTTTSRTIDLWDFQTYTFKVAATNAAGEGARSASSNPATPTNTPTAPGAPTNISAARGNGEVTVGWWPARENGSPITGYVVTPYIGASAQTPRTFDTVDTEQTITGLANGTTYTFKVTAKNAIGTSPMSAASNAVKPAGPPGAPTGVTAVAGNAQVTVSWSAPASNGGSPITGYAVMPYVNGFPIDASFFESTATSQIVTSLANGTTYTFKVAAYNDVGGGTESAASNAVKPTAGGTASYAPFASWAAFVNRQYVDITTKSPSASERSSWVSQLSAGTKSKGDLVDALRRGSENLANVDPVVRVYRAFLGRAPDSGGLQFWIKRRRNVAPAKTWTVTQIATEFTNSSEFKTKYGSLTNRAFVTQIYTDVLLRPADPSGVNYWSGKLDSKKLTKAQVVVGFSESNEYKTKQAQNTDVAVAYIYLMGRSPTVAESNDWVPRQQAGTTHATLLTELLNSSKYATRITG